MNALLLLLFFVAAFATGYVIGRLRRQGAAPPRQADAAPATPAPAGDAIPAPHMPPPDPMPDPPPVAADLGDAGVRAELHRLLRSAEAEAQCLRAALHGRDAAMWQLGAYAEERRGLLQQVAAARAETARYRQLAIDVENNAPPVLFGPASPDDLKLIVGIGPVLERLLHQLGVTSYRQIARWSERDIDDIDARLAEFPGRIRRDGWVTQARSLHQSKYGEPA